MVQLLSYWLKSWPGDTNNKTNYGNKTSLHVYAITTLDIWEQHIAASDSVTFLQ
jgi:hypothetical protein